jgi:hypothetical protein
MNILKTIAAVAIAAALFIGIRAVFRIWWKKLCDLSERTSRPGGDHFMLDRD